MDDESKAQSITLKVKAVGMQSSDNEGQNIAIQGNICVVSGKEGALSDSNTELAVNKLADGLGSLVSEMGDTSMLASSLCKTILDSTDIIAENQNMQATIEHALNKYIDLGNDTMKFACSQHIDTLVTLCLPDKTTPAEPNKKEEKITREEQIYRAQRGIYKDGLESIGRLYDICDEVSEICSLLESLGCDAADTAGCADYVRQYANKAQNNIAKSDNHTSQARPMHTAEAPADPYINSGDADCQKHLVASIRETVVNTSRICSLWHMTSYKNLDNPPVIAAMSKSLGLIFDSRISDLAPDIIEGQQKNSDEFLMDDLAINAAGTPQASILAITFSGLLSSLGSLISNLHDNSQTWIDDADNRSQEPGRIAMTAQQVRDVNAYCRTIISSVMIPHVALLAAKDIDMSMKRLVEGLLGFAIKTKQAVQSLSSTISDILNKTPSYSAQQGQSVAELGIESTQELEVVGELTETIIAICDDFDKAWSPLLPAARNSAVRPVNSDIAIKQHQIQGCKKILFKFLDCIYGIELTSDIMKGKFTALERNKAQLRNVAIKSRTNTTSNPGNSCKLPGVSSKFAAHFARVDEQERGNESAQLQIAQTLQVDRTKELYSQTESSKKELNKAENDTFTSLLGATLASGPILRKSIPLPQDSGQSGALTPSTEISGVDTILMKIRGQKLQRDDKASAASFMP